MNLNSNGTNAAIKAHILSDEKNERNRVYRSYA